MEKTIITNSAAETAACGEEFGCRCVGGEIIAISGDLGAGKTCFVQGLAKGLGLTDNVNSPTFNIMKIYGPSASGKSLCHIDAYRLNEGKSLAGLGVDEYFGDKQTVSILEWPEKVEDILPKELGRIIIEAISENERRINIIFPDANN